jgi:hypothetical protein
MGLTPNDSKTGRTYSWGDETFVSVTTVLGALSKPALPNWAAKSAAEFVVNNYAVVSDLISQGQKSAAVDLIKGAPWRQRDKAADLGSSVHAVVEAYCEGKPTDLFEGDERAPFLQQFLKWLVLFEPEIEESEVTVFNRATGPYAGTLDLICKIDGLRWLIDLKTGKGVYPEHALQIAAYSRGEFIGRQDGTEGIMPIVDRGAVLHVRPSHFEFRPVDIGEETFASFRYVLEAFRWQNDLAPSAIHPAVLNPSAISRSKPKGSARGTTAGNFEPTAIGNEKSN